MQQNLRKVKIQEFIQPHKPFKFTIKWDSDIIYYTYTFHLILVYQQLEGLIFKLLYIIYMQRVLDYWQQSWSPSSLKHIALIFTDYYILENNSLLKAALKYKRIQLTDFRAVPIEHFGESKILVSVLLLWVIDELVVHLVSLSFLFIDLPLKISYPPDFSDSRHYGLLLLV